MKELQFRKRGRPLMKNKQEELENKRKREEDKSATAYKIFLGEGVVDSDMEEEI
jgi:hypothetical protein